MQYVVTISDAGLPKRFLVITDLVNDNYETAYLGEVILQNIKSGTIYRHSEHYFKSRFTPTRDDRALLEGFRLFTLERLMDNSGVWFKECIDDFLKAREVKKDG